MKKILQNRFFVAEEVGICYISISSQEQVDVQGYRNESLMNLKSKSLQEMDVLTKEQRHKNMSAIKSKGTKIEELLGKALWSKGLRYRKNDRMVFGKPDFTFRRYKIAVFCDSEFFHGKNWDVCKHRIKTNTVFWHSKIEGNIDRDRLVNETLLKNGWQVFRFWGEEIKKNLDGCVLTIEEAIERRGSC